MKLKLLTNQHNYHWPILCVFATFSFSILILKAYLNSTLRNNINNHILSAEMFGIPEALKEKGLETMYFGENTSGWDGQFYYYIANDIFAQKDTANHIDAPAYRYQRIGLSLWAFIISRCFGLSWVPPLLYYSSNLMLILIATYCGSKLFDNLNINCKWILAWSCGVGTQITLLNGLPDAAADSFLIIGIFALTLKKRQYALYLASIALSFAALSREVYIIFPFCLLISAFLSSNKIGRLPFLFLKLKNKEFILKASPFILAGSIFICWHIYIRMVFKSAPADQASGILSFPFIEWLNQLKATSSMLGSKIPNNYESISTFLFMVMNVIALLTSWFYLKQSEKNWILTGFSLGIFLISLLYFCFGRIVMMHYSGYFKAANMFFYGIPLLLNSLYNKKICSG